MRLFFENISHKLTTGTHSVINTNPFYNNDFGTFMTIHLSYVHWCIFLAFFSTLA